MSGETPKLTAAQVLRALRKGGWMEQRQSGSHLVLIHAVKPGQVIVPVHARKTIKEGTMRSILKMAGLTAEEFRRLL